MINKKAMKIFNDNIYNYILNITVPLVYIFLYLPIIILILFSFNNAEFPISWQSFTLKWYIDLFSTKIIWQTFYNSFLVSILSTFITILMTLAIIYYSATISYVDKIILIFYGNVIIPEIVLSVGLLTFFSFLSINLNLVTLTIAHTILSIGLMVPIVYNRFKQIDKRLIEASLDLGASENKTFFKIILPLIRPSITATGLLVFILSFDDFLLSFFCSGSESQTLSLYIFSMLKTGISPVVNALSTILLALSSLLVLIFCKLNNHTEIF